MDDAGFRARQARGLELAKSKRIKRMRGGYFVVPSQSHGGTYVVDAKGRTCTCPDHATTREICKHWWAVEIHSGRVTLPDGTAFTMLKITYGQDWHAFPNLAAAEEREQGRGFSAASRSSLIPGSGGAVGTALAMLRFIDQGKKSTPAVLTLSDESWANVDNQKEQNPKRWQAGQDQANGLKDRYVKKLREWIRDYNDDE